MDLHEDIQQSQTFPSSLFLHDSLSHLNSAKFTISVHPVKALVFYILDLSLYLFFLDAFYPISIVKAI